MDVGIEVGVGDGFGVGGFGGGVAGDGFAGACGGHGVRSFKGCFCGKWMSRGMGMGCLWLVCWM